MWALVRKPIPLRSNWSPPTLQYATRVFLEKIIDGLYGPGTRSLVTVRKSKHNQGEKARESGCMFVCFWWNGTKQQDCDLRLNCRICQTVCETTPQREICYFIETTTTSFSQWRVLLCEGSSRCNWNWSDSHRKHVSLSWKCWRSARNHRRSSQFFPKSEKSRKQRHLVGKSLWTIGFDCNWCESCGSFSCRFCELLNKLDVFHKNQQFFHVPPLLPLLQQQQQRQKKTKSFQRTQMNVLERETQREKRKKFSNMRNEKFKKFTLGNKQQGRK